MHCVRIVRPIVECERHLPGIVAMRKRAAIELRRGSHGGISRIAGCGGGSERDVRPEHRERFGNWVNWYLKNLTTDNTDNTDFHGSGKRSIRSIFKFVNPFQSVFIRGEICFFVRSRSNLPNYQILSAPFMHQAALETLSLSITSLPGAPAFHSLLTDCTLP